jgi:hypothetical protein
MNFKRRSQDAPADFSRVTTIEASRLFTRGPARRRSGPMFSMSTHFS